MTKKELGLVLLCFLIMMLFIGVCGGGFAKTDFEKELKAAQKEGYAISISTKYTADDVAEYSTISVYSQDKEIKSIHFDRWGSERWHSLYEYNSAGHIQKIVRYDEENEPSDPVCYFYDGRGNRVSEHSYMMGSAHIYHYRYDEQNRKISMEEEYGEGICPAVLYSSSYFYDEEGRLSKEEIFANGIPYSYIIYEYDGTVLIKEEEYRISEEKAFYHQGTEYGYDEEGRLIKIVYYDGQHNCSGYMTYEYYHT